MIELAVGFVLGFGAAIVIGLTYRRRQLAESRRAALSRFDSAFGESQRAVVGDAGPELVAPLGGVSFDPNRPRRESPRMARQRRKRGG